MAFQFLVIDLDGTLLARDGSVSAANRRAVAEAREAGMEVIIATGRALTESRRALEALDHDGLVVAAGGSLLCDAASGRTLDRRILGADVLAEAVHPLLDHGHKVLILKDAHAAGYDYLSIGNGDLDPASRWWFDHMSIQVRDIQTLADDPHPDDTVRAGAVACESRLAPLASRLRDSIGDRCFLQHWSAVTQSHAVGSSTHLLEIFTANVNKWTMIEALCERRGVDPARVAAIGDGLNDVELVQNAGLGIAMANSNPLVLAAADHVCEDHESDGVARAIDRILTGEWCVETV